MGPLEQAAQDNYRQTCNRIDYRNLLKKYINHVGECEGTVFLSSTYEDSFTKEEYDELLKINKEL